jgi:phage anti-repressor protein
VTVSVIPENGGRSIEYHGTLSMAKELAMGSASSRPLRPVVTVLQICVTVEGKDYVTIVSETGEKGRLVEGRDYVIISEITEKPGRPSIDYHATLIMAKELALTSPTTASRHRPANLPLGPPPGRRRDAPHPPAAPTRHR